MKPPNWLTCDFLKKVLNQEILDMSVDWATKPGDNYSSSIYRVVLETAEKEQLSLIVKATVDDPESKELMTAMKVFPKETLVYEKFLPNFESQFLQQTGEIVSFSPRCYYTEAEPLEVIVLSDLMPQGYVLRNRRIGLSEREVQMVLLKMAKFHASSLKFYEEHGAFDDDLYGNGNTLAMKSVMENYYDQAFETFLWSVRAHIENGETYASKLENLRGRHFELFNKLTKPQGGEFNVLAHSDLWINNFLFNGDELTSTDVKFIDYQMCRWTSPALELFFFFITSCSARTIVESDESLVEYYHGELVGALEALGCLTKAPALSKFKADLDSKGLVATIFIYQALVVSKADPNLDLSGEFMAEMSEKSENIRKTIYSGKEFVEGLKLLLPHFEKKGYLNIK